MPLHLEKAGFSDELHDLQGDALWLCNRMRISDVGVSGLHSVLFRGGRIKWGQTSDNNIILIEGAPGTGKTTLALQMLMQMATWGSRCILINTVAEESRARTQISRVRLPDWDDTDANVPTSSPAARIAGVEGITVKTILRTNNTCDTLWKNPAAMIPSSTAAVLIDDIGVLDRQAAATAAAFFRKNNILAILILETLDIKEGNPVGDGRVIEYLSDLIIRLGAEVIRMGRRSRSLEVVKSRFHNSALGTHRLRLSNRSKDGQDGVEVIVFPAISVRDFIPNPDIAEQNSLGYNHTGIANLDVVLAASFGSGKTRNFSSIVVRDTVSSIGTTVAFNLLVAAMWSPERPNTGTWNTVAAFRIKHNSEWPRDLTQVPLSHSRNNPALSNHYWIHWEQFSVVDVRTLGTHAAAVRDVIDLTKYDARIGGGTGGSAELLDFSFEQSIEPEPLVEAIRAVLRSKKVSRILMELPWWVDDQEPDHRWKLFLPVFLHLALAHGALPVIFKAGTPIREDDRDLANLGDCYLSIKPRVIHDCLRDELTCALRTVVVQGSFYPSRCRLPRGDEGYEVSEVLYVPGPYGNLQHPPSD